MRFCVFCRDDAFSRELGDKVSGILVNQYHEVYDEQKPQMVICIGGDGTILRAIQKYLNRLSFISFCAIHTGTLGFFTDYTKDELDRFLHDLYTTRPVIESCRLIEAELDTGDVYYALNEIRIGSFTSTVHYDLEVDGEFFESVCSSGICICTQAGSTGASRALNGAVVESGLEILELTQIMPVSHRNHHSLTSPCIFSSNREIEVSGNSLEHSILCYDHLETDLLKGVETIRIRLSDKKVRFARLRPYSYLERLKNLY